MLRMGRPERSWLAGAGLGWVLLPLICASAGAQVSASRSYPRGSAEPDRPRREAATTAALPGGGDGEGDPLNLAQVDQELAEIDGLLATAHFVTALALLQSTRDWLGRSGKHPQLGVRQARLELMAATAEVALGRRSQARRSLERALQADPNLALDEREASPKLVELLREARRRTGSSGAAP